MVENIAGKIVIFSGLWGFQP